MRFYLGTGAPHWLGLTDVPLFVSARRLRARPGRVALGEWALDSGGFTELRTYGRWTIGAEQYAEEAQAWAERFGRMAWATPQDWMCEPEMIHGGEINGKRVPGTGLSVAEHQRLTIANYLRLEELAPGFPWVPVLQGWSLWEYLDHAEQYRRAGVFLETLPLVGVGSVCRRQSADLPMVSVLVRELCGLGLRLHAFGLKLTGLPAVAGWLESADSMSWSYAGRRGDRGPACTHPGKCNNCLAFALHWRRRVLHEVGVARGQWQEVLW